MQWLYLLLALLGLGLLWLLIKGLERLIDKVKLRDFARQDTSKRIAKRTASEEKKFLEVQEAKEFLATADLSNDSAETSQKFTQAVGLLTSEELMDSMVTRLFGEAEDTQNITATQSAFDKTPVAKAVATGDDIQPVKTKPSSKSALSKSEQKLLKKIRQGD